MGIEQPGAAFGHVSVLKWLIYTQSTKALSVKISPFDGGNTGVEGRLKSYLQGVPSML